MFLKSLTLKGFKSFAETTTLEFEPGVWETSGLYLLASVLDRFLALHATVNSFVRTRAVLRGRTGRGRVWPARAGMRVLL